MSLTDQEKAALAKKVGNTASIMISSVVRLYLASPNPKAKKNDPDSVLKSFPDLSDAQWKYTNVMGALVLVMDRTLQTFLFRIYDIEPPHEMRFEFELYEDIEYKALDLQFHSFEMEDCVGGFSFASKEEAPRFLSKVNALKPSAKDNAVDALKGQHKSGGGLFGFGRKEKKKPTPPQISSVVNVVHTQHIGINPDGTFDLNNISPEWKQLFRQAGIKKKDLANPEVAKAIVQTIAASTGATVHITPQKLPTEEEMKQYYTPEQQRELEEYQKALAKYEADLAAYEAEQAALAAWERDNAKYLAEQAAKEKAEQAAKEKAEQEVKAKPPLQTQTSKKGPAPVAPPRVKKETKEEAAPPPRRRSSLLNKVLGLAPEKSALEQAEEDAAVKEQAEKEAEATRRAAETARIAAEQEAEVMRVAAATARKKAEEEAAAWLAAAAAAKTKAEQDALMEQKQAEDMRLRAQEEALRLKEEAAEARRKAQAEAEQELREAAEARRKAQEEAEHERAEALKAKEKAMLETKQAQEQAAAEREYVLKMQAIAKKEQEELMARARQEAEAQRLEAEAIKQRAKEEAEALARAAQAEREYAQRMAEIAKREHEEMLEREREKQRKLAEIAAKEEQEMMEQLRLMQERTRQAKALLEAEEAKAAELQRLALKKRAPPIPARLPDKPPLPAAPPAPPKPPMPPSLPPIPAAANKAPMAVRSPSVLLGLGEVKLKKVEEINDKSAPNVTGKGARGGASALLGGIEQGVKLKSAPQSQGGALPSIQDKKVQANIMTSLIETMNVRRGALRGDDSDDDDGWSD